MKRLIAIAAILALLLPSPAYAADSPVPSGTAEENPVKGFTEYAGLYHYGSDTQSGTYKKQSLDGAITIDFETETIHWSGETPQDAMLPRFFSVDGGKRWKGMRFTIADFDQREAERGNFTKYLNKKSELRFTTALDPKTKQPQTAVSATENSEAIPAARVYSFTAIAARPKMDRFTAEYLTDCDYWVLVNKRGTQTMANLQVAFSEDGRSPAGNPNIVGDMKFGLFQTQSLSSGTRFAVPVVEGTAKPGERLVYLIRIKPTVNSAGSKTKRIAIQSFGRRPKLKMDYKKGLIKVRAGIQTVTGGMLEAPEDIESAQYGDMGIAFTDASTRYAQPYVRGDTILKEGIKPTYGVTYGFRMAATGRRPASMTQAVTVQAEAVIYETDIELRTRGSTVVLPAGYEMQNPETQKWVKSFKTERNAIIPVRSKNTAKYNPSNNQTRGALESKPIYLDIVTDVDAKGRAVVANTGFIQDSEAPTFTLKAAYMRAAETEREILVKPSEKPQDIPIIFEVKGSGSFVWEIKGLEGQDAYTATYQNGDTAFVYEGQTRITLTGEQQEAYKTGKITITLKDGDDPAYEKFYAPVVTIDIKD